MLAGAARNSASVYIDRTQQQIESSISLVPLSTVTLSPSLLPIKSPSNGSTSSLSRDPDDMSRPIYGTTSPPPSSSVNPPSTPSRRLPIEEGHASIPSSVTNLANTVIGAGALAFPSAFAAMGLIPGMISCVLSGTFTAFGLYLLSRCATLVGKQPGDEGRKSSFNEVARLTFGKGWATKLFDVSTAPRNNIANDLTVG